MFLLHWLGNTMSLDWWGTIMSLLHWWGDYYVHSLWRADMIVPHQCRRNRIVPHQWRGDIIVPHQWMRDIIVPSSVKGHTSPRISDGETIVTPSVKTHNSLPSVKWGTILFLLHWWGLWCLSLSDGGTIMSLLHWWGDYYVSHSMMGGLLCLSFSDGGLLNERHNCPVISEGTY
jgi:hypothetical protein